MSVLMLCSDCDAKHKKETRGIDLGGGAFAFNMPAQSRCTTCSSPANGFKYCLSCAVEKGRCQGCGFYFIARNPAPELLSVITAHRTNWTTARGSADATYEQSVASYKDAIAQYEAGMAASKQQFEDDIRPLQEAEKAADANYEPHQRRDPTTAEAKAAWTAWNDARTANESGCDAAFKRMQGRERDLQRAFAQYWQYDRALHVRSNAYRKADGMFQAEVERSVALWRLDAERAREAAKVEESYKRSVSFHDTLDRSGQLFLESMDKLYGTGSEQPKQ